METSTETPGTQPEFDGHEARAIANELARRLGLLVETTPAESDPCLLRTPGEAYGALMLQAGTLETGTITPEKAEAMAQRIAAQVLGENRWVTGWKDLPLPGRKEDHAWHMGLKDPVRVRVVRTYDIQDDDFITRADVLVTIGKR